jgi:hypothetical protein
LRRSVDAQLQEPHIGAERVMPGSERPGATPATRRHPVAV